MRRRLLIVLWVVLAPSAWGRTLLKWTEPALPAPKQLGVTELVIQWDPNADARLKAARAQGYRLFVEAAPDQVEQVVAGSRTSIAGVIVEFAASQLAKADEILAKLRAKHPNLTFLLLDPNGKQPNMRGTTVIKREGILEITSPTAQPWIDSNVPLVRFQEGFHSRQVPLYTFEWDTSDPLRREQGPTAMDYCLAIAEAGALHADLVLNVHPALQKRLAAGDPDGWALWKKLLPFLKFTSSPEERSQPEANIAVVTNDYDTAYEPMNLMARHNIPFRVLPAANLNARTLEGLKILLLFSPLDPGRAQVVVRFASQGGTAVAVGISGQYPWQSAPSSRIAERSTSYALGRGSIIELSEPVTDPETFAQDVRRLMKAPNVLLSLWNALTVLGVPYRASATTALELVNYASEPVRVQARLRGSFSSVRIATPELGCCQTLHAVRRNGFTEFVIPELRVGARILLRSIPERR